MLILLVLLAAALAAASAFLSWRALQATNAPRAAEPPHPELFGRLAALEREVEKVPRDFRADFGGFRQELKQELVALSTSLQTRLAQSEQAQSGHLRTLREEQALGRKHADEAMAGHVDRFSETQSRRLGETNAGMKELRERTEAAIAGMSGKVEGLTKDSADKHEALRGEVRGHLERLSEANQKKLDEMRGVVDEKLSATLNERLDHSFKQVSDRLEAVHKGLGEMQTLATGVGDLKRVLTNVKSRGTWGEVQLGALLEDMLTPDQFERQARIRPDSGEVVDFAIRLPGQDERGRVLLPIDCKYPQEDYERLIAAQEAGDAAAVETAGKALERALRVQAKSINEKYVHPPLSTNFAIMYLPTEGLFAEVVRRAAFAQELQQSFRITVAGPTTLAAVLNSLRMGFTTLEIQKKSSEVWTVLGHTKSAFEKYGAAMDAVDKKLDEAKKKVADVGVRHREIARRLRGVESIDPATVDTPHQMAALASPDGDDDDAEAA